jgi:hypothetical protein
MATQRHRYEPKNDMDDLEQMSIKLSADLRKNIRALVSSLSALLQLDVLYKMLHRGRYLTHLLPSICSQASYPVLSDNWCGMADMLGRIAAITEMESKLPRVNAQQTLWEGDEQALR